MDKNENSINEQWQLVEQWKKYGLNNPHLLIVKNTFSNDDCVQFLQHLTHEGLKSSKIRRLTKRSFVYQKLKIDCTDHELIRLLDSPLLVCEIYNYFTGMFVIDISEFISEFKDHRFEALLNHVYENEDKTRYTFIANTNSTEQADSLFAFMSKRLALLRLDFVSININELMDYVAIKNKTNNIKFDDQAELYLESVFKEMLESKSVDTLNQTIRLSDKIAYDYRDNLNSITKDQLYQTLKASLPEFQRLKAKKNFGF